MFINKVDKNIVKMTLRKCMCPALLLKANDAV